MNAAAHSPIRVVIIDDHALVREGLRLILGAEPGIEITGEAADAAGAFDLLARAPADVALVDITLGAADGMPLLHELHGRYPTTRTVAVTMHADAETVRQAFLAGASGYVVKGAYGSELVAAVRSVARGGRYVHADVAASVIDDSLRWLRYGERLSPREREVIRLVADGLTAGEAGRVLGISAHTVRRHMANLAAKLGVRGRVGLVRYALEHGLARPPLLKEDP